MDNKIIINVGRQIGCGGCEIAQILAKDFNAKYLDKGLLNLAAKESGFSEKLFKESDEHHGFLHHLFHSRLPLISDNAIYENKLSPEALFKFQSDAIRKAAEEGSCVIMGRCADYVLRDMPGVINIFISANLADRVKVVMKEEECDESTARQLIEKREADRAEYYNYYTGKKWGAAESYDLCINSSFLGIEGTAEYVAEFITRLNTEMEN